MLTMAIMYLIFAFVQMEINAVKWEEKTRYLYIILGFIASIVCLMLEDVNKRI